MRNLSPEAAVYGILQVAYAALDWELTKSLVRLSRSKNPRLVMECVPWQFGRKFELIGKTLKAWPEGNDTAEAIQRMDSALQIARSAAKWRNERIHARVEVVDGAIGLFDSLGQQLRISYDECDDLITRLDNATSTLRTYSSQLVSEAESSDRILEMIAQQLEADDPEEAAFWRA